MSVTSRDVEMISGFVLAAEGAAHQGLSPGFPGCCFLTNLRLELLPAPEPNPKFPLLLKPAPSPSMAAVGRAQAVFGGAQRNFKL